MPEGSLLGPALWKVFFNNVIMTLQEHGYPTVAYADDLVATNVGNSRTEAHRRA